MMAYFNIFDVNDNARSVNQSFSISNMSVVDGHVAYCFFSLNAATSQCVAVCFSAVINASATRKQLVEIHVGLSFVVVQTNEYGSVLNKIPKYDDSVGHGVFSFARESFFRRLFKSQSSSSI